jgi:hypothetical protein
MNEFCWLCGTKLATGDADGMCSRCSEKILKPPLPPTPSPAEVNVRAPVDVHLPSETPRLRDEEVWLRAWTATASAANCGGNDGFDIATNWADKCLEAFKERFRK